MSRSIVECQHVSKTYGEETVLHQLNVRIEDGKFTTILGPSGCGKTTLLRLISGFEQPNQGRIYINSQDVTDLPPQQRQVNTVFQSYALFPHMSVFENVAFGLRCEKRPQDEIEERVHQALTMVKLHDFKDRKPKQLSGGQQQRVALARAVIKKPLVLLLDEPLSALDYRLRKDMQTELKSLQHELGMTFIFVTHDQEEALSLSDHIIVLDKGVIQQFGSPREIYEEPANLTVAKFVGEANILDTVIVHADEEYLTVLIEDHQFQLKNKRNFTAEDHIYTLIRPEDLRVWDDHETNEEEKNHLIAGKVVQVNYKGSTVDLIIELPSGKKLFATEFFDEEDENLDYHLNEQVWVEWWSGWEIVLTDEH